MTATSAPETVGEFVRWTPPGRPPRRRRPLPDVPGLVTAAALIAGGVDPGRPLVVTGGDEAALAVVAQAFVHTLIAPAGGTVFAACDGHVPAWPCLRRVTGADGVDWALRTVDHIITGRAATGACTPPIVLYADHLDRLLAAQPDAAAAAAALTLLAADGPARGVTLITTAATPAALPEALRPLLQTVQTP